VPNKNQNKIVLWKKSIELHLWMFYAIMQRFVNRAIFE